MNRLHGSRKVSTVPNSSTSLILGDDATRNMIKVTAVRPDLRHRELKLYGSQVNFFQKPSCTILEKK